MNFKRDPSLVPPKAVMAPELAWLKATHGDVANPQYWMPNINSWDFGVGALLGTEGTDIIFNMKGMVLLELPGPHLLIMMKANVLAAMPDLPGDAEGTILAVIDLDFGRGTHDHRASPSISSVDPLIEINIPIEAFFDFNATSDWHFYLGQYSNPVQAKVLQVFDASGYLMLSGSGIPAHNGLPAVTGFSIAAGLHVSFKWGVDPLYAELAAGFDAVVGFSPFRMAGKMNVRGTLHLFILDIERLGRPSTSMSARTRTTTSSRRSAATSAARSISCSSASPAASLLAVRQHGTDPRSAQSRQVAQADQPLAGAGGRHRDGQADRLRALPTRSRATPVEPASGSAGGADRRRAGPDDGGAAAAGPEPHVQWPDDRRHAGRAERRMRAARRRLLQATRSPRSS